MVLSTAQGRFAIVVLLGFASGSCMPRRTLPRPVEPVQADVLRGKAVNEFRLATFHKPRETDSSEGALAPLVVQELGGNPASVNGKDTSHRPDLFGDLEIDKPGQVVVDVARPTLYFATGKVSLNGDERVQVSYVWFYPVRDGENAGSAWRGVRLTLDADGFPIIAEVHGGDDDLQRIFVAASLEAAARAAFGEPLPGRRFSIERAVEEAPRVVVVRTFEDGPVPMGPYVYLEADTYNVRTVLCRCSPSQVGRFVSTDYYDLETVEALVDLAWGDSGGSQQTPPMRRRAAARAKDRERSAGPSSLFDALVFCGRVAPVGSANVERPLHREGLELQDVLRVPR